MNRMLVLVMVGLLAGCSGGSEEPEQTRKDNGSRVSDDNVFSSQVKALEKAEGVEQTLMDAERRRREQMEEQSR
ncbi:MAG TPA: hypothetical protein ENJ79_10925 [Gammaproteobacteria bacterium]|nr:hypothetical protein [Gammaproteobacteria bacterium]